MDDARGTARAGYELRIGVIATESQVEALLQQVGQLLCPDPDHPPPCPVPWSLGVTPFDEDLARRYDGLYEQATYESREGGPPVTRP